MTPYQIERAKSVAPKPPARLFSALAKSQGEFPAIPKSKQGHGYKYAPVDVIQRLVRPVLSKNGLGFVQHIDGGDMVTVLLHESGESLETRFPMRNIEMKGSINAMQTMGAVSTYAARYGLCLALGISADEDTDAHNNGSAEPRLREDFTNPNRDGHVQGVKGVQTPPDATPRQKAEAFAKGIEKQLSDAKTPKGVTGAWDRNAEMLEALQERHVDLYHNVLDLYEARMGALQEEET